MHIYTLPYFDPAMARDCLKDEELRGFPAAYAAVLEILRARLDSNAFNILVAHCFVAGAETSESESPLFIGGSGEVPGSLFNGFDYVALGHLHRAQTLGERIRYSGSPLKYSFDEEHHKKSVTVLEVGDTVTIRPIPVVPLRDMRTLSGPVEALEEAACADAHKNDYISAELTGLPVYEPMHRLRRVYPNTLSVRNGSFAAAAGDEERAALRKASRRPSLLNSCGKCVGAKQRRPIWPYFQRRMSPRAEGGTGMRPELVRMRAFGPYLGEASVDFAPLWQAQIFLITGPTAGGKPPSSTP